MHARTHFIGRFGVIAFLALTVLSTSGCSHLQFGSYASFDDWYVGRDNVFRVDQFGFTGLDGTFTGYVINDIVIRSPVYVVYEATWLVLLPVALPYYGVKSLAGGSDNTEAPEAAAESPAEADDTDGTDESDSPPTEAEGGDDTPGDGAPEGAEGAPQNPEGEAPSS